MPTAVQRRRGTTAQHASFTGLNAEVTVDTDKEVLVVHDGATPGGYPQARENLSNVSEATVTGKVAAATASVAGKVQLTDSISSTSTTTAATPNSVKQAYDLANAAAKLNVAQTFSAAQRGAYVTLTDAATIATDMALGNHFQVTLGGNRTLGAPTNVVAGQSGVIRVVQDGTGSRTLAYNSVFKFPGGTAPTLTTAANSVDLLAFHVESATRIAVRFIGDVK